MSQTEAVTKKVTTAAAWKKAKIHEVILPSGVEVSIEIPNMAKLVQSGQIPNDLIDAALGSMEKTKVTPTLIKEQAEFFYLLVSMMVKEPKLAAEDIPDLPYEDIEMLVAIGTRQTDIDAVGHNIAGLHKSADWRRFRGLDYIDSDVEGV